MSAKSSRGRRADPAGNERRRAGEQSLKDHGARLSALIASGDAALEERRKAERARIDHRVRSIITLVADINAARGALFGNLAGKGAQAGLPVDWPSRFFKRDGIGGRRLTN